VWKTANGALAFERAQMIHSRSLTLKLKMPLDLAAGWRKTRFSLMLPYVLEHRLLSLSQSLH
jgi:hypothetical protein